MGDMVNLHGGHIPLDDNKKPEFVADMARFAEGILTEQAVKKKYRFDNATWEKLGDDDVLVELIGDEKVKRIRSGDSARERAQIHFAAAPNVLGDIPNDQHASPRHRIESAKELRVVAANGSEAAPATERFQIIIDLGDGCVERYDKPIAVDADPNDDSTQKKVVVDDNSNDTDAAPQGLLAIAARADERTTAVVTLFERLGKGRPPPLEPGGVARKLQPAQKLLDWLQHWNKPTVSEREIRIFGPRCCRDRETASGSAEVLVTHNWLNPRLRSVPLGSARASRTDSSRAWSKSFISKRYGCRFMTAPFGRAASITLSHGRRCYRIVFHTRAPAYWSIQTTSWKR